MKQSVFSALVAAAVLFAASSVACKKKAINPNDSTSPTVVIKLKTGATNQYEPVSSADLKVGNPLNLACTVSDQDGVRSINLSFSADVVKLCIESGQQHQTFFQIPLPPPQVQNLQGDASGNVLDSTTVFTTLSRPTCTFKDPLTNQEGTGVPLNHVIKATCVGKNWSSNAAKSTTTVTADFTVK